MKLATRAERFGSEETKKLVEDKVKSGAKLSERAARFGLEEKKASNGAVKVAPEVSAEALEKRATRFGKPEAAQVWISFIEKEWA